MKTPGGGGGGESDDSEDDELKEKQTSTFADALRAKVSKKKRRFQQDGFDLDLSYITEDIIAMGYPSEGFDGVYRNSMKEVQRFFKLKHPSAYKMYNLCSERSYDPYKFEGRVVRYPFDDHNPCEFDRIEPFCKSVQEWLRENPKNVTVIHCKAGKGRTGLLISCYLLYSGRSPNADAALQFFAVQRTKNEKGVTIPSQIRFVHYFDRYLKNPQLIPKTNPLFLTTVTMFTIPKAIKSNAVDVWFRITCKDLDYSSKGAVPPARFQADSVNTLPIVVFTTRNTTSIPAIDNDVRIEFYHSTTFGKVKMFQFWFNTRLLEPTKEDPNKFVLYLPKPQIDKACKDHKHKIYEKGMALELIFFRKQENWMVSRLIFVFVVQYLYCICMLLHFLFVCMLLHFLFVCLFVCFRFVFAFVQCLCMLFRLNMTISNSVKSQADIIVMNLFEIVLFLSG